MRSPNRWTAASLVPALMVGVSIVAAGITGSAIGAYFSGAPKIGHIIAFEPSPDNAIRDASRIELRRPDQPYCIFDLNVVRRLGGSLIVERQLDGDAADFRVHWAGQRTSDDAADCGGDAVLIAGRQELDRLASSAGGYIVSETPAPLFTPGMLD
jgi:hypothetical protein